MAEPKTHPIRSLTGSTKHLHCQHTALAFFALIDTLCWYRFVFSKPETSDYLCQLRNYCSLILLTFAIDYYQ